MNSKPINSVLALVLAGLAGGLIISRVRGTTQVTPSPTVNTNFTVAAGIAVDPRFPWCSQELQEATIGWWQLNEGTGGQVYDASGNNLNGQMMGAMGYPKWDVAGNSVAVIFDGRQNDVQVPDTAILTPTGAMSMAAWVYVNPQTSGLIAGKWSQSTNTVGSYTLGLVNGHPVVELSLLGTYRPLTAPQALPADGNWHHLACAYDGRNVRLYVDAKCVAATYTGGAIDPCASPLILGQLEGALSDVRLFNIALNDMDAVLLYRARPPLPQQVQLGALNKTTHPRLPFRS